MPRSHEYRLNPREVLGYFSVPLLVLAVFVLTMHSGARLSILPAPIPTLDVDRTILLHQAQASQSKSGANLVLVGDSSCLMNVDAARMEQTLGGNARVLNLGTLSYLELQIHTRLLANYAMANPEGALVVVLLMHPETLRLASRESHFETVLESFFRQEDYCSPADSRLVCLAGVPIFRGRILTRLLPIPLPGVFGEFYGFDRNLWDYMSERNGSALDPGKFRRETFRGSTELRLAGQLESPSKAFKRTLRSSATLVVGITPSPAGIANESHQAICAEMLRQWGDWLSADATLSKMPFVLEDEHFASTTHLSAEGVARYSRLLAHQVQEYFGN